VYSGILFGLVNHVETIVDRYDSSWLLLRALISQRHAERLINGFRDYYAEYGPEKCGDPLGKVKEVLERTERMFSDLKTLVETRTGGQICTGENNDTG
jgi:hypothetical protein